MRMFTAESIQVIDKQLQTHTYIAVNTSLKSSPLFSSLFIGGMLESLHHYQQTHTYTLIGMP